MINKIKNYFIQHKYYLSIMILFTLFLTIIVSQVVLYADDFSLYQKSLTYDINVVLNEFIDIYLHWGGGPTHGFAIIVLMLGFGFWKILNILMITFSVHMFTHMIVPKSERKDKLMAVIAFVIWCFIFLINIFVLRETIYWFDGSMAYVLTTFLTLSYIYFCYRFIVEKKQIHNIHYVLMCVLGFFSGWNGPQMGAIAVLIGILFIIWQHFIKKEKINRVVLISNIFVIIGFAILYFAPGNYARMAGFTEYNSLGLLGKIIYRMDDIALMMTSYSIYGRFNIPSYLFITSILAVAVSLSLKQEMKSKKLLYIACTIIISYILLYIIYLFVDQYGVIHNFISMIFNYEYNYNGDITRIFIILIKYSYFLLFILSLLYLIWNISAVKDKIIIFMSTVAAIGTQFVMLMAPYSPYRSAYISIIFFIFSITLLIYELIKNKEILCICLILGLCFYEIEYAILFSFIFILVHCLPKKINYTYMLIIGILIPAIANITVTFKGYYLSKRDNDINYKYIEQFKKNGQKGNLILKKMHDETYCFTPIYSDSDWIRKDVKKYFHLNDDVNIIVEE